MDMGLNDWAVLVLLILVAIFALVFASAAAGTQSIIAVLVSAAAIIGIFYRVKQYFDRTDAARH